MPGKRMNSIKNKDVYHALRRKGYSKKKSAKISNAQLHKHGKRGKH
jgi:hypothetical protein